MPLPGWLPGVAMHLLMCSKWLLEQFYTVARGFCVVSKFFLSLDLMSTYSFHLFLRPECDNCTNK